MLTKQNDSYPSNQGRRAGGSSVPIFLEKRADGLLTGVLGGGVKYYCTNMKMQRFVARKGKGI